MHSNGHLLVVLHHPPTPDDATRDGRFLWRNDKGKWQSSDIGNGRVAIQKHLDEYTQVLDRFENLEEKAGTAEQYLELLEGLSPIMRATRNMLQAFEEARKAVQDDRDLIDARDQAYEIARTAELLYNDAKNSMDVAVVRRAEQQAAASDRMELAAHRLNVLAALFFPIATLGAVFGTTLTEGWSISRSIVPFAIFLGVGLLSGIIMAVLVTRKTKST